MLAWVGGLTVLVLAPLVRPGYALTGDMVFAPQHPVVPDAFGLGTALPRAVPVDAVMAGVTTLLDGAIVQRIALASALVLAGLGGARLATVALDLSPRASRLVAIGGASIMLWNPYVAERLGLGHWSLLLGYGALPWAVAAALSWRGDSATQGVRTPGLSLMAWTGLAALTPGGGLIGLLTVLPVLAWPGGRRWGRRVLGYLVGWAVLNAPWWLPGLLAAFDGATAAIGTSAGSDPQAIDLFAAQGDTPLGDTALGVAVSLVGLGGVWNSEAVPGSRGTIAALVLTAVLVALATAGFPALRRAWGGGALGLLVAAALGLVLASWGALLPDSLAWLVVHLPGAGLLRDGQRLVAPLAVLLAAGAPRGAHRLGARAADRVARRTLVGGLALLPLLAMPDLAWGVAGRISPVDYPDGWANARTLLVQEAGRGDDTEVASLPWQPFRQFGWNPGRVVLDPAPRFLDRVVRASSDLPVRVGGPAGEQVVVEGEDPRARLVGAALQSGRPATETLPPLAIGWLMVEESTPGAVPEGLLEGADLVLVDGEVRLYRVGEPGLARGDDSAWASWSPLVLTVDALAVGFLLVCLLVVARRRWRTAPRVARVVNGLRPGQTAGPLIDEPDDESGSTAR